jgi:hypothetical protein
MFEVGTAPCLRLSREAWGRKSCRLRGEASACGTACEGVSER